MKQDKIIHLEVIRIIAVILIIFNHVDGYIYYTETENFFTWIFSCGMASICRMGVPLFFMVSGALLLGKEESVKELFVKRVSRMLTVLVAVSVFYYIMDVVRYRRDDAGIEDFLRKLCTNGIRESLWFLYGYIAILLTLPFFREMVKTFDRKLMGYLMLLKVLFSVVIPLTNAWFGISIYLDAGFVGDYIFYMILGYCMENQEMFPARAVKLWQEGICLAGLTILDMAAMRLFFLKGGSYQPSLLDLPVCITAPITWMIGKQLSDKLGEASWGNRVIVLLGGCVFGIYLLDNFVRWQLLPVYLFLSEKTFGIFACSVYVLLTFLLGFFYTYILKKIPLVKKFL